MLLFSYYINDKVDKAWFDSSNIVYAECDESESAEKTVRVVFRNGQQYRYDNVNVYDWTLFKNSDSQGKALNSIFKKNGYSYEKIDDANLELLKEEYAFRSGNGYRLIYDINGFLQLIDCKDVTKWVSEEYIESSTIENYKQMLESLGNNVKLIIE